MQRIVPPVPILAILAGSAKVENLSRSSLPVTRPKRQILRNVPLLLFQRVP